MMIPRCRKFATCGNKKPPSWRELIARAIVECGSNYQQRIVLIYKTINNVRQYKFYNKGGKRLEIDFI